MCYIPAAPATLLLQAEIGVFLPMMMLKSLEPPSTGPAAAQAAAQASIAVNAYSYK